MTNQTVGNKGICSNGESPLAAARSLFFHVGSSPPRPPPPSPLSLSPLGREEGKSCQASSSPALSLSFLSPNPNAEGNSAAFRKLQIRGKKGVDKLY